jgi:hypothetical protein
MPDSERKDFIGFIMETEKADKKGLLNEFWAKDNDEDLHKFFQDNKFTDIKRPHCKEIVETMNRLKRGGIIPKPGPCDGTTKGY